MNNQDKQIKMLSHLRHLREDKKERALIKQKNAERQAQEEKTKKRTQRQQWQNSMPQKEDMFFSKVKNKKLSRRDLEKFRTNIHKLYEHENTLMADEQTAIKAHEDAIKDTAKAKDSYHQALKERNKSDEMTTNIKRRKLKEQEHQEDDALDEFATNHWRPHSK